MFGIDFGSIGRSLISNIAGSVINKVPGLNQLASQALKLFDSLPIDEIREFAKKNFGIDPKEILRFTFPPAALTLDIRDGVAQAIGRDGLPERGTTEFSNLFNAARLMVGDYYEERTR